MTLTDLTDQHTGRWQVTTQTSIYLLDLNRRTMLRVLAPAPGCNATPPAGCETQRSVVHAMAYQRHPARTLLPLCLRAQPDDRFTCCVR